MIYRCGGAYFDIDTGDVFEDEREDYDLDDEYYHADDYEDYDFDDFRQKESRADS